MHRIIVRHLPHGQPDEATERAFYAVPAYIAAQPRQARDQDAAAGAHPPGPGRRQNFGESLARAAFRAGPAASGRMDARLQLLARQDLTACTGSCRAWSCTCARTWSGSTGRC